MPCVIITGVPGVGKSTVIEAAKEHAGYPVVVYGTVMFEVAEARGLVKDRDEMRKLDPSVQRDIQVAAAEKIGAMGDVIVDTHCTIRTPKGYLPGIPSWVARSLNVKQVILVEASPEEIQGRRTNDASRVRDADSVDVIAEHQAMNRSAAMSVAYETGATVKIVVNADGMIDATRDAVIQSLA